MLSTLRTGRSHPHPEPMSGAAYSSAELMPGDRSVALLDQRKLPTQEKYEILNQASDVADAIRNMVVRGAPAIGIAAAYGMVLAANSAGEDFLGSMERAAEMLCAARPTAINLANATRVMLEA